jgi:hypothetical protein
MPWMWICVFFSFSFFLFPFDLAYGVENWGGLGWLSGLRGFQVALGGYSWYPCPWLNTGSAVSLRGGGWAL